MAVRKGDVAKSTILAKLGELYPNAIYSDKKLYVWEKDDGGQEVQIAITLTMPKTPVESGDPVPKASSGAAPWEDPVTIAASAKKMDKIIASKDEEEMVEKLLLKLGITE